MALTTTSAIIDETGITVPAFADIFAWLQDQYKAIYGADTYLASDSQDGQWLAIQAKAKADGNNLAADVYHSFSPDWAQGVALSSLVKLNGLRRKAASYSSVVVTIIGQASTQIANGAVDDDLGQRWLLPSMVEIPLSGEIDVTATAGVLGAVIAAPGTVTKIVTPTPGWQTVTNAVAATVGKPVESDAALRVRQALSTAKAATSPAASIRGAVLDLPGVNRARVYNNTSDSPDANGIPAHSISVVVDGGDVTAIAETISFKKGPGCGTYGDVSKVVIDSAGIPDTINFFSLDDQSVYFNITIQPLNGYLVSIGDMIIKSVVQYLNDLGIGEIVYHNRLFSPANLSGDAAIKISGLNQPALDKLSTTFNILKIELSVDNINFRSDDVLIPFNAAAVSDTTKGVLAVIPV